jgi:hypothetical protein
MLPTASGCTALAAASDAVAKPQFAAFVPGGGLISALRQRRANICLETCSVPLLARRCKAKGVLIATCSQGPSSDRSSPNDRSGESTSRDAGMYSYISQRIRWWRGKDSAAPAAPSAASSTAPPASEVGIQGSGMSLASGGSWYKSTFFTSTKVQILTQNMLESKAQTAKRAPKIFSLLLMCLRLPV